MKKLQQFDQNHGLSRVQKCQFCLLFKSMLILSRKACFLTRTSANTFSGFIFWSSVAGFQSSEFYCRVGLHSRLMTLEFNRVFFLWLCPRCLDAESQATCSYIIPFLGECDVYLSMFCWLKNSKDNLASLKPFFLKQVSLITP